MSLIRAAPFVVYVTYTLSIQLKSPIISSIKFRMGRVSGVLSGFYGTSGVDKRLAGVLCPSPFSVFNPQIPQRI